MQGARNANSEHRGGIDRRRDRVALINRYLPMASSIKSILNLVVIVLVCVWLLQATGMWASVTNFRLRN